jgi:tetratricopeptide (TPR) repeat protein
LYRKLGEFKLAVDDYSAALLLAPSQVRPSRPSLGATAPPETLTAFTWGQITHRSLGGGIKPDLLRQVRLHNNRGYCLAKLGRFVEAVEDYNAVGTPFLFLFLIVFSSFAFGADKRCFTWLRLWIPEMPWRPLHGSRS